MPDHHLQIKDLTVSYNRVPALHHINMGIDCGHCVALLGPNGAGKTTFFKTLVGLVQPDSGSVTFHGQRAGKKMGHVAYLPQRENVDWDFPITVRGLVEMGCYLRLSWWRKFTVEDDRNVEAALKAMHLEDLADRQISALSGGQQQRAFLARALAQQAHIFLFDEPFAGLDKQSQETLGQTIKEIAQKGDLVIASHHDLKNVPDFFDQVIFLNGELIAYGDTDKVFNERKHREDFFDFGILGGGGMNWLLEPLHHEFMQRAFLACALIGFTNGFLSAFIVLRRLALMADALSHALLPGVAVGMIIFGLAPISLFIGAISAALMVGLGAEVISRSSRVKEETALAILYTVAFSAGIILLQYAPVHVELDHYLFGNILGVSNSDLWMTYGVSFVTISTLVLLQRPLFLMLFDQSVAATQGVNVTALNYLLVTLLVLAMISSLQAVGVILALGLLVAPAATIYLFSDSCDALFWGGGFLGLFGSCSGLLISYWWNLPAGACIVLFLGLMFCLAYIFSPRYGLIRRFLKRGHMHTESLARWKPEEHTH